MKLERTFLLSLYVTLGLACVCLCYAVQPHLPELAYLTAAVLTLLPLAWWAEGRWSLSNRWSNLLGMVILAAGGGWVAYRAAHPPTEGRIDLAILSAPMLPYLGALMMVLMAVKLFRTKRVRDCWWLFGIGFMAVALACVLDNEALFGLLLAAYLAAALWSLSLFYLVRGLSGREAAATVPFRAWGVRLAARRALLVAGLAMLLFLATPRLVGTAGNPFRLQTGLAETGIDLNRTGTIQLNTDVAIEVAAQDQAGQAKTDLDAGTRFRGMTLNTYSRGCWGYRSNIAAGAPRSRPVMDTVLADLGPGQFTLHYTYQYRPRHRLVLAEPIIIPADPNGVTAASLRANDEQVPWMRQPSGELLPPIFPPGPCRYFQVTQSAAEPVAVVLDENQRELLTRLPELEGLQEWTRGILKARLAGVHADVDGIYPPETHEQIARALEGYLASSGEYSYSLELPRRNTGIDPVLDFLWNVKRGHCQRFAGGLAAMLRSQGVPSRVVIGFQGVEHLGEGRYVIRHSQAHAWVEALVTRGGARYWLPLDPTPGGRENGPAAGLARWWQGLTAGGDSFWRNFVLDYHADRQTAVAEFWGSIRLTTWLLILPLGLVLALSAGWLRRRNRQRSSPFHSQIISDPLLGALFQVLARRLQLIPRPEQTPLEFADQASRRLHLLAVPPVLQDLPVQVAQFHYQQRYGGKTLPTAERLAAQARIADLDRHLG